MTAAVPESGDYADLYALREQWRHAYTLGHDSDGIWWAVRNDASIAPLEADSAEGLQTLLVRDDRSSV